MTVSAPPRQPSAESHSLVSRLWKRELDHYPDNGPRYLNLALVIGATIGLYFMMYVSAAVAVSMMQYFNMSFAYFAVVSVIGGVAGAIAALVAGLADRWGRANIVAYGVLLVGLITTFVIPNLPNKESFLLVAAGAGFVEGLILVASPAMVRDFSPQLGRATAMGMWNTGPVIGSLVVAVVASLTLDTSSWKDLVRYAGVTGIALSIVAIIGLRDLAPRIRNQIIVSTQDRQLIEARGAADDTVDEGVRSHWRTVLRVDVVLPAIGIAFNLLFYLTMVGNSVIFFTTVHGWTEQRASSVNNWAWASQAVCMILIGLFSDRLRVRKPFILTGSVLSIVFMSIFAYYATEPGASYNTMVFLLVALGVSGSIAYAPWLAGFTENVERHGPAATAAGLAIWGWATRLITAAAAVAIPLVVSGVTPVVEHGDQVTEAGTRAAPAMAVIAEHPDLFAELSLYPDDAIPTDLATRAYLEVGPENLALVTAAAPDLAVLKEFGPEVAQAAEDAPHQWETWFWVCVAGQLLFLPTVFLIGGRWDPRRARSDFEKHEQEVSRELRSLNEVAAHEGQQPQLQ